MRITDWPKEDRPREKLLAKGTETLTDAELLAVFLKSGVRGKTALDIAKELIHDYGHLHKLLRAPAHELLNKPGIGSAKYATLIAALELGKRYDSEHPDPGTVLSNSIITQKFLQEQLSDYSNEVFACLFMDSRLRLIAFEKLFHGTVNEAIVHPREIVRKGLAHNAANIILAHNHPSKHPAPSKADKEVTRLIQQALRLVDIEVVDHVIVGKPDNFSFAEAGLI